MGNLYLIEMYNEDERFFKIGITVHRYCRFYEIMKSGYRVRIVCMVMGIDYLTALNLEYQLKCLFYSYRPKVKFGGHTECFINVDVISFLEHATDFGYSEIVSDLEISWR